MEHIIWYNFYSLTFGYDLIITAFNSYSNQPESVWIWFFLLDLCTFWNRNRSQKITRFQLVVTTFLIAACCLCIAIKTFVCYSNFPILTIWILWQFISNGYYLLLVMYYVQWIPTNNNDQKKLQTIIRIKYTNRGCKSYLNFNDFTDI